jgi:hypothetical protein
MMMGKSGTTPMLPLKLMTVTHQRSSALVRQTNSGGSVEPTGSTIQAMSVQSVQSVHQMPPAQPAAAPFSVCKLLTLSFVVANVLSAKTAETIWNVRTFTVNVAKSVES